MSDRTKIKTIRLPEKLAATAEEAAKAVGLSFNQLVTSLLKEHVTGTPSREAELLSAVAAWIGGEFTPTDFPHDVTLRTFHQIRDDEKLRAFYDSIVLKADGTKDVRALMSLHRRIGLQVKEILRADVMGRSLSLDPGEHLIKSYALLKPKGILK